MPSSEPFKWRHFQSALIWLNVRWYLRYSLSYRDLKEMMLARGVQVNHTTIYRWVQAYGPELDKRCRRYLKPTKPQFWLSGRRQSPFQVKSRLFRLVAIGD